MLKLSAEDFLELGQRIEDAEAIYATIDAIPESGIPAEEMEPQQKSRLTQLLKKLEDICVSLEMPVSRSLIESRIYNVPKTGREFQYITTAIYTELNGKFFLFLPPDKAKYYDLIIQSFISTAFPTASKEIVSAANCYAVGQPTACVFHAMRAVEIGLRAMALELFATLKHPIELCSWGELIAAIEPEIEKINHQPRTTQRDADQKFYSDAASQFRYFNNGWRVRVDHARESYDDREALKILEHTMSFFDTISHRLGEF